MKHYTHLENVTAYGSAIIVYPTFYSQMECAWIFEGEKSNERAEMVLQDTIQSRRRDCNENRSI
jgi:hypothetical protein